MRWIVIWDEEALQTLADIWINAPDRHAVGLAADYIDDHLKSSPDRMGEDYLRTYEALLMSASTSPSGA